MSNKTNLGKGPSRSPFHHELPDFFTQSFPHVPYISVRLILIRGRGKKHKFRKFQTQIIIKKSHIKRISLKSVNHNNYMCFITLNTFFEAFTSRHYLCNTHFCGFLRRWVYAFFLNRYLFKDNGMQGGFWKHIQILHI